VGSSDPATHDVLSTDCGNDFSLLVTVRALWNEARMTEAGIWARCAVPTVISVQDDGRRKSYIDREAER
jgi:hypothetical protein